METLILILAAIGLCCTSFTLTWAACSVVASIIEFVRPPK